MKAAGVVEAFMAVRASGVSGPRDGRVGPIRDRRQSGHGIILDRRLKRSAAGADLGE